MVDVQDLEALLWHQRGKDVNTKTQLLSTLAEITIWINLILPFSTDKPFFAFFL